MNTTNRVEADPVQALWLGADMPAPRPGTGPALDGTCSRCRRHDTNCRRVKKVVSDKYTSWDQYTHELDPVWCPACCWAHTEPTLRTRPHRIVHPARLDVPPALATILAAPLPDHLAVIVPLSRHKHLAPHARWGHLTTDDRTVPWTPDHATRYRTLTRLAGHGFTAAHLSAPTPDATVLLRLTPADITWVYTTWNSLDGWRADPHLLAAAHKATTCRTDTR